MSIKHSHASQHNKKSRHRDLIRVLVSLSFIAAIAYLLRDKWHEAFNILKQLNWLIFGFVCLLFVGINLMTSYRLKKVLSIQAIRVGYRKLVYLNFIGLFFNLFLPSSLGGDVVKAYYISKESGTKLKSISSIVADRLFGLTAVIFVALISLPFFFTQESDPHLTISVLVFASAFFLVVTLLLNQRMAKKFSFVKNLIPTQGLKQKLTDFYHTISYFRHHPKMLLTCFGLSLMVQIVAISMGYLVSNSLSLNVDFYIFLLILPVTSIISMLPSLGGLGVREASVVYFLSKYSSVEGATAFVLAYDILIYGFGLICGIVFALLNGKMTAVKMGISDD